MTNAVIRYLKGDHMRQLSLTLLSAALVSTAAFATQPVPFVSGGIGEEGRQAIAEVQQDYNLKLVFTGHGGMYLSDVSVGIRDSHGQEILRTESDGPILLANLEPGTYTVDAEAKGYHKTQSVKVGNSLKTYGVPFPIRDEQQENQSSSTIQYLDAPQGHSGMTQTAE